MKMLSSINKIAKRDVEITVRGDRSFTLSFESIDKAVTNAISKFFGSSAKVEVEEDEECGTFIYVEV